MILLFALLALAGAPKLGPPASVQEPDGTWACSAMCLTGGNDDGGYCRTPLVSRGLSTKAACEADLALKCSKTKPPPGGCRWGDNPPPVSK